MEFNNKTRFLFITILIIAGFVASCKKKYDLLTDIVTTKSELPNVEHDSTEIK